MGSLRMKKYMKACVQVFQQPRSENPWEKRKFFHFIFIMNPKIEEV